MKSFKFVCIPADSGEPIAEWSLDYKSEDEVGCLMTRLQQHFRDEEARIARGLSSDEVEARKRRVGDAVRENMPKDAAQSITDEQLRTIASLSYLVGQVPLLDSSPATGNVAVNMYICDTGRAKGLQVNQRASGICAVAGNPTEIFGDAFIARVLDDNRDKFARIDFGMPELDSGAEWIRKAVEVRRSRRTNGADDMQRFLDAQKAKKGTAAASTATDAKAERHQCKVCGKEAAMRCSRCKAVWYDSAECQKADWKNHKPTCKSS